jgi:cytochrome c5
MSADLRSGNTPRIFIVLLLGGAFVVSTLGVRAQELPPGSGRDAVTARCLSCHESDLIVQQRLSRAAWARSVDKMVRWGAVVESGEREPMLDYLAAHFAPKPAAGNIVATAGSEAIYKRACLTCHEDDLIESQRLTRAGWMRSVEKMIRWGASLPAADKDPLVDYLAARYPPR